MATNNMHMKFEIEIPKQTQVTLQKPCHLQISYLWYQYISNDDTSVMHHAMYKMLENKVYIYIYMHQVIDKWICSYG